MILVRLKKNYQHIKTKYTPFFTLESLLEFTKVLKNLKNVLSPIQLVQTQFLNFENNIKLIYSATSATLGNNGNDKNLSPYAFTKSKNLELLENLKTWFNFKYEVVYFYNVYGPGHIKKGPMATVIGIFEDQFKNKKPLTIVKPGNQSRRFTHINDTVDVCFEAWKNNKCAHYSISHKKSYSIIEVAKMFKSQIVFLKKRPGERYASALTKISLNNKVFRRYGKINLKDYISSFIKR